MKFLKILLIIVLLCVPLISYGTGTIESGEKLITLEPVQPDTLDEWFCNLALVEKVEIFLYWHTGIHSQNKILSTLEK